MDDGPIMCKRRLPVEVFFEINIMSSCIQGVENQPVSVFVVYLFAFLFDLPEVPKLGMVSSGFSIEQQPF